MNDLARLLTSFDVSIIFAVSHKLAASVGMFIAPTLLLLSIYIRLMETQLDALVGSGKYGTALRDMVLWTVVLGSYYGIGNIIFEFFNPIYAWFDSFGSLAATMKSFSDVMAQNKVDNDAHGMTLIGVMSQPYVLIASLLYYVSLVIVAFIAAFLKIANALVFGIAFVWGLIAIPMSISITFNILRGWAVLLAFALVWPIVQGLLMAMFSMLFTNSVNTMMEMPDADATLRAANIMLLFSVMHLILGAVMVAAPFVANALVSNTSAATGIVMPFVAAATAAGVATVKGAGGRVGNPVAMPSGSSTPRMAGSKTAYRTPTIRAATASFASASLNPSNPSPSGQTAVSGSGVGNPPPMAGNSLAARQQQQRRGAIIRQNMKGKAGA